jgi:hypothetical protein
MVKRFPLRAFSRISATASGWVCGVAKMYIELRGTAKSSNAKSENFSDLVANE